MSVSLSARLFTQAQKVIPGGVNSPARAMEFVQRSPLFIEKAQGSHIYDVDGMGYIDYVLSWGSAIVGHSHPKVVAAVGEAAKRGLSFGAPTSQESALCEKIMEHFPHMDQLRLVCSGTEACMSAVRLARAFQEKTAPLRHKILKFHGHYHGHSDGLLVRAGSGLSTLSLPGSAGVTPQSTQHTLTSEFGDGRALEELFEKQGSEMAAVILEVVMGNGGFILPQEDFLTTLKHLCTHYGVLIIADEVMSGFRAHRGGAASRWSFSPDITVLGKVIGGGLPLAAYGAREEIMSQVAPVGEMYQAGTLSGNPVAVACGLKTLEVLLEPGAFERLCSNTQKLCEGLEERAGDCGVELKCSYLGGMFGYYFTSSLPRCYREVQQMNHDSFCWFFHHMLENGVYLPPSPYESCFMSLAHNDDDLLHTLEAAHSGFSVLKKELM